MSFPSLERHGINATEADIVGWTKSANREIISSHGSATQVIKMGKIVVKFGNIYEEESRNQQHAFQILSPDIFQVPEVYHFFEAGDTSYLVMEFVAGESLEQITVDNAKDIARRVDRMHQCVNTLLGPFREGGICRGRLWPEGQERCFDGKHELEGFVNSRIVHSSLYFALSEGAFSLCHMDLAPRNIRKTAAGYCLLDWEYAGSYPRTFEMAVLRCNHGYENQDGLFCDLVEKHLSEMRPLSHAEEEQIDCMVLVAFNNICYSL